MDQPGSMNMAEMPESAVERVLSDVAFSLRECVRRHDRFVVIAFLFSCLPLPPACFVGLLLGLVNGCLLKAGRLDRQEGQAIGIGLLLGFANSLLAVLLIVWVSRHVMGLESVATVLPGQVIEWLQGVFRSWPLWWGLDGAAPGEPI